MGAIPKTSPLETLRQVKDNLSTHEIIRGKIMLTRRASKPRTPIPLKSLYSLL